MQNTELEPGIYFGLDEAVYHSAVGLSNSGIKQLAVSPLNYWHNNFNPEREPPEESPAMRWGRAVHCRLLEPERFGEVYAAKLSKDDHPDALDTDDDLKEWLTSHGLPTTGKRKQERIERIRESGIPALIWDDLVADHAARTEGKELLSASEVKKLDRLHEVVFGDPYSNNALTGGVSEVSIFVRDPESGALLKGRMDKMHPWATIDLKTFSNSRGKPTDKAVFDAIYYEGYYQQAVFYQRLRELARQELLAGTIQTHGMVSEEWLKGFTDTDRPAFGFVFVEASEPFDLRVIQLTDVEAHGGQRNVYWNAAAIQIADATQLYAECLNKFGTEPWREPAKPHVLQDADLPQLMFA